MATISPDGLRAGRLHLLLGQPRLRLVPCPPTGISRTFPPSATIQSCFVTVCTHRRKTVLASPQCHAILHEIWERSAVVDQWWVGHYILMPDHVHFFARPEIDAKPTAKWVQAWKGLSSRKIIKALGARSPILAGRLLRSLPAFIRELLRKVALRRTERDPCWTGDALRRLALPRHHSRLNAVVHWSRHALVPVAQMWPRFPPTAWGQAVSIEEKPVPIRCTAKVFPQTSREKTFEVRKPLRLRAGTGRGRSRRARGRRRCSCRRIRFLRLLRGRIYDGRVGLLLLGG